MEQPAEKIVFAPYDKIIRLFLPIIPRKLRPNHLTFLRLILSPFLIFLLLYEENMVAIIWFAVLALTDMIDGSLARLRNQVTEWGKVWDPIADKVLIGIVVIVLLLDVNLSLTILLLSFEAIFLLGGAWQKLHNGRAEIKANVWGKIKMNFQCFGAGALIVGKMLSAPLLVDAAELSLYVSVFFAVASLIKRGI